MFNQPKETTKAISIFEDCYGSLPMKGTISGLTDLLHQFAFLPYENLSKIVAWNGGLTTPLLRRPLLVMEDHVALGTGGTCFSLTELLRLLSQTTGFKCYPVMAHMRHATNIHCALRVEVQGAPYLVDPGYLVRKPLPLSSRQNRLEEKTLSEPFLVAAGSLPGVPQHIPPGDFDLFTLEVDGPKWRYRFSDTPPSEEEFLFHWINSFHQPAMHQLIATRRTEDGQFHYLHNHKLRLQVAEKKQTVNVRAELEGAIEEIFGISKEVTQKAAAIIRRLRETKPTMP